MKIVVVGSGYVGLSNAVLLAQHNEVVAVDIVKERVEIEVCPIVMSMVSFNLSSHKCGNLYKLPVLQTL